MKSLLTKEIKHLAFYAVLAFVGLIAYAAYSNYIDLSRLRFQIGPLVIWTAPVVAFFFGFWQCFSEQSTGKSSFMIQRSVSLSQIFWCKALAGLSLTALITIVPFIGQEAWRIYSNRYPAPAHWDFSTAELCLSFAVVTWMSGVFVAVRPAKWWGSRLLPVVGFVVVLDARTALAALAVAVVYTIAAHGVFTSSGVWQKMGWLSTICLGTILGTVGTVLLAIAITLVSPSPDWRYATTQQWTYSFATHRFVCATSVDGRASSWRFLDGPARTDSPPLSDEDEVEFTSSTNDMSSSPVAHLIYNNTVASYFDNIDHVFKQYDLQNGRLISTIDQQGFRKPGDRRPIVPFRSIYWSDEKDLIVSPDGIYRVDRDRSSFEPLVALLPGETIVGGLSGYTDFASDQSGYPVVTNRRIIVIDPFGRTIYAWKSFFPIAYVSEIDLDKRDAVVWLRGRSTYNIPSAVFVLHNGKMVDRQILTAQETREPSRLFSTENNAFVVCPLALYLVVTHYTTPDSPRDEEIHLSFIGAGALISIIAMLCISRRLEWTVGLTLVWIAATVFVGAGAVIAALALYDWPARVACPACGKKRLVTKAICKHCGATWPLPLADGNEIFDDTEYGGRSVDLLSIRIKSAAKVAWPDGKVLRKIGVLRALAYREFRLVLLPFAISVVSGLLFLSSALAVFPSVGSLNFKTWFSWDFTWWIYYWSLLTSGALAIGQFGAETRSPQAASFTAQRPVSAACRFAIKLAVGLLAYVAALITVLGIFYWYSRIRGNIPGPFPVQGWDLGQRDALIGFLFWFGTVIVMARTGPWYGRRLLPLLFCIGATIICHNAESLTAFSVLTAVAYVILALAAFGIYAKESELEHHLFRIALAAIFIGSAVFVALSVQSFSLSNQQRDDIAAPKLDYLYQPIGDKWPEKLASSLEFADHWKLRTPQENVGLIGQSSPLSHYYWFADGDRGILLCYFVPSRKPVGFVDATGWHRTDNLPQITNPLASSAYAAEMWSPDRLLVWTANTVYAVNADPPSTDVIYRASSDETINWSEEIGDDILAVNTTTKIVLYDINNLSHPIFSIQKTQFPSGINTNVRLYVMPIVSASGADYYASSTTFYKAQGGVLPASFQFTLNLRDSLRNTYVLNVRPTGETVSTPSPNRQGNSGYSSTWFDFGRDIDRLSPLSFGVDGSLFALCGANKPAIFERAIWPTCAAILLTILLSLRMSLKPSAVFLWALGALILGLYAPIALLALYNFPPRVRCPNCGGRRFATTLSCGHCGALWPEPARRGIEIFDAGDERTRTEDMAEAK
jgi:DNA-directed RNA polymerase subunit RPC12/RpoP